MRRNGFTLIELMIVVAIIGILAAIAIPNFLKFQCKARTVEARANLGAIFTLEMAHIAGDLVSNSYSSFGNIGWSPMGNCRYSYHIDATVGSTYQCGSGGIMLPDTTDILSANNTNYYTDNCTGGSKPSRVTNSSTDFLAIATGNPANDATLRDFWSIDQNRNLTQNCNGCL